MAPDDFTRLLLPWAAGLLAAKTSPATGEPVAGGAHRLRTSTSARNVALGAALAAAPGDGRSCYGQFPGYGEVRKPSWRTSHLGLPWWPLRPPPVTLAYAPVPPTTFQVPMPIPGV